jgi:hypothetical protein
MVALQLLERADGKKAATISKRPEGDCRVAQAVDWQDMARVAGRHRTHLLEVKSQKVLDVFPFQLTGFELPSGAARISARTIAAAFPGWRNHERFMLQLASPRQGELFTLARSRHGFARRA